MVEDTHTPSAGKKEYTCNYCKKKGHLASVCRKRGERRLNESGRREQTNLVMEEQDNEQDEKYEEYTLYQVSNGSSKPLMVPVQINVGDGAGYRSISVARD